MNIKSEKDWCKIQTKLVWAQMRYSPYWPAKVVDPPPEVGNAPPNKKCVLFFGTKQYGFVEQDRIIDFVQNRYQMVRKGRGVAFNEAVKQMDEFISDPKKYRSNAFIKPVGMKIKVKEEQDIGKSLGIQMESRVALIDQRNISSSRMNSSFTEEKQKLVDACAALKTENQKLTFDLKKKCDECTKLTRENENVKQEAVTATEKVEELTFDSDQMKAEFASKTKKYEQQISVLRREIQVLTAREKQFKMEIGRNVRKDKENKNDAHIFDVEKLLDDKMIGKVRYYLVRWKGFQSTDDTWESESNLMCPSILAKYLQKKRSP